MMHRMADTITDTLTSADTLDILADGMDILKLIVLSIAFDVHERHIKCSFRYPGISTANQTR